MTISDIRRDYDGVPLDEAGADADPLRQFARWFEEARASEADPTAMALATAGPDGRPAVRMVLLKGVDEGGFVFFSNYQSRKAEDLDRNPLCELLFYWASLNRQVRVSGRVERVAGPESDAYFASRPPDSRLAACASPQSRAVADRAALDALVEQQRQRFPQADMPRPESWGGYRVVPDAFEFWQGRPSRLHDRLSYRRQPEGGWRRVRLAP